MLQRKDTDSTAMKESWRTKSGSETVYQIKWMCLPPLAWRNPARLDDSPPQQKSKTEARNEFDWPITPREFLFRKFQRTELGVAETVLVLRDAPAIAGGLVAHHVFLHQRVDRLLHLGLAQIQHRLAVGLLIAGIGKGIEGQRILIGSGNFLFDQAPDDPRLVRRKFYIHGSFQLGAG